MSKYIIRNCDCILSSSKCNVKSLVYCQDCTDCVMKQIVELCKDIENIENVKTFYDAIQCGMFLQANKILKLLDIQECE